MTNQNRRDRRRFVINLCRACDREMLHPLRRAYEGGEGREMYWYCQQCDAYLIAGEMFAAEKI